MGPACAVGLADAAGGDDDAARLALGAAPAVVLPAEADTEGDAEDCAAAEGDPPAVAPLAQAGPHGIQGEEGEDGDEDDDDSWCAWCHQLAPYGFRFCSEECRDAYEEEWEE